MAYHTKKKKTKKAVVGATMAALALPKIVYGGVEALKARRAARKFDKSKLRRRVSDATRKMAEEPISQSYIENLQQQQASDRASAMGALSKDPRNLLGGLQALEASARKQRTDVLGLQDEATRRAMDNLAKEQRAVEDQRLAIKEGKLSAIQDRRSAAIQNIFGGAEDTASGIAAGALDDIGITKKGGKIDKDGGVTPGEFDHDTNPIDMVKDGEKIGEATGGELILPPDDVEEIRMALQNQDKDEAFDLMQKLVAKYDSNVIGGEDDLAQEGGMMQEENIPKNKIAQIMQYVMVNKYLGREDSPDYFNLAKEKLDLTDKEVSFMMQYADSKIKK